jgi:hypothetical protein
MGAVDRERSFKIVRGHVPLLVVPGAREAGLTTAISIVLSTFRSGAQEMVLDHALWLACVQTVAGVVGSTSAEVYAKARRRVLERFRRPRLGPYVGLLDDYGEKLLADPSEEKTETDSWSTIHWHDGAALVAAAGCEPWYAAGGPALYHDSYTTSILVAERHLDELTTAIEAGARQAGGWLEVKVDEGRA